MPREEHEGAIEQTVFVGLRPGTLVVLALVVVLIGSAMAVVDGQSAAAQPEYRHMYEIHVDEQPYRSVDGSVIEYRALESDVQEAVQQEIQGVWFVSHSRAYTEEESAISEYEYVEYRGLYYEIDVVDKGVVEVMNMAGAFRLMGMGPMVVLIGVCLLIPGLIGVFERGE